jgi:hypothetical protein
MGADDTEAADDTDSTAADVTDVIDASMDANAKARAGVGHNATKEPESARFRATTWPAGSCRFNEGSARRFVRTLGACLRSEE